MDGCASSATKPIYNMFYIAVDFERQSDTFAISWFYELNSIIILVEFGVLSFIGQQRLN